MNERNLIDQIKGFFRGHWPHLLAAIPLGIIFTALHEFAHSAAGWLQAGTVTSFVWLPSSAGWGHMSCSFPAGAQYSMRMVTLAPYFLYLAMGLLAGALSLRRSAWSFPAASTFFVWLFVVPVADIANTAIPYALWNTYNDFHRAFGHSSPYISTALLVLGLSVAWYGYWLNRRLYCARAVGFPAYCILALAGVCMVVAAAIFQMG